MEKKNKNKSAYKNPSDLFRRTKSRLALQKFLENLRDQERGYSKGDKQITQCVFLGALRLKPVPDIFQVTLQPISFSTQSNNSVLYNGKTVNKREKAVKNKKTELVKIDEKSLENKTSSIKTNLFINQKPRNRILELFSSNISPKVSVPKKPKVTLKLNTKRKNENKFKYKIKLKGILNRNKKDIVQKVDKATIKNRTAKKEQGKTVKEKTKSKNCEKKSKQDNKPVPIGQKKCESENRDRNLTIKNTISSLKIEITNKSNSYLNKKKTVNDNIPKLKNLQVKKMEGRQKQVPLLMPVNDITCRNPVTIELSDIESNRNSNQNFLGPNSLYQNNSNSKEPLDIIELDDDEIEDYLEIDQNIVADLEALIPDEEIESISNTLIKPSVTEIPEIVSVVPKRTLIEPVITTESSKRNCDSKIVVVNSGKFKEIIKIDDIKEDVEIEKVVEIKPLNDVTMIDDIAKKEVEHEINISEITIVKNDDFEGFSDIHKTDVRKAIKRKSEEGVSVSKKQKLVEDNRNLPNSKKEKRSGVFSDKVEPKCKSKPKIEISKTLRKITDFLFPTHEKHTDKKNQNNNEINRASVRYKKLENLSIKIPVDISENNSNAKDQVETRILRSGSKQSPVEANVKKLKKNDIPKLIPIESAIEGNKDLGNANEISENLEQPQKITINKETKKKTTAKTESKTSPNLSKLETFSNNKHEIIIPEPKKDVEDVACDDSDMQTQTVINESIKVLDKIPLDQNIVVNEDEKKTNKKREETAKKKSPELKISKIQVDSDHEIEESSPKKKLRSETQKTTHISVKTTKTETKLVEIENPGKTIKSRKTITKNKLESANSILELSNLESQRTITTNKLDVSCMKQSNDFGTENAEHQIETKTLNITENHDVILENNKPVVNILRKKKNGVGDTLNIKNTKKAKQNITISKAKSQNQQTEIVKNNENGIKVASEENTITSNSDGKIEEQKVTTPKTSPSRKSKMFNSEDIEENTSKICVLVEQSTKSTKDISEKIITNILEINKLEDTSKISNVDLVFSISQNEKAIQSEEAKPKSIDLTSKSKGNELKEAENMTKLEKVAKKSPRTKAALSKKKTNEQTDDKTLPKAPMLNQLESGTIKRKNKVQKLSKTSECQNITKAKKKQKRGLKKSNISKILNGESETSEKEIQDSTLKTKNNVEIDLNMQISSVNQVIHDVTTNVSNEVEIKTNFAQKHTEIIAKEGCKTKKKEPCKKKNTNNPILKTSNENNCEMQAIKEELKPQIIDEKTDQGNAIVNESGVNTLIAVLSVANLELEPTNAVTQGKSKTKRKNISQDPPDKNESKNKTNEKIDQECSNNEETGTNTLKAVLDLANLEMEPLEEVKEKTKKSRKKKTILQKKNTRRNINNNETNKKTKESPPPLSSSEGNSQVCENKDPVPNMLFEEEISPTYEQGSEGDSNCGSSKSAIYHRVFRCRVCLKVYKSYNLLRSHKKVHAVQNPYQCQECGNSYDDVEEYFAHLRVHKGKMPYPCKKCDSSFWTPVQLERHQLVHVLKKVTPTNNSSPKKVFKCEECGKEFIKICDLERHTRVHTGEKPSVCNICNKRFQQPYNLNKHLLIHTQEKKFECVICQKKFGRNDVLNRHVLTHSINKPYRCLICSKTFIRNTQLKFHIRKHHGKQEPTAAMEAQEAVDDPIPGKSSD